MRVRALPLTEPDGGPSGEAALDADATNAGVRGAVSRAIQRLREAQRAQAEPEGAMTLEILPPGAERWVPVHVDAGSPPPYTRLRIDSPFEVDWDDIAALIRLTHRYWVSRMRLLERARARRGGGTGDPGPD
ncbi:hypothetical protein [Sediminicurvatus halobius]|uniref:Uncharacterized protein n=1 Tax=Sediminicurvatus halobius TaxID=2182432 RepID=A0A2U2N859_9GAMM|nr:hypothetical protein [Spiribacter halobius]PWG65139.1 hypothetical protein DEM34_02335 [Spiribacter halobius]UEX78913.1 hypothetical protein LMH63_04525 [Spiribacter halobius]